MTAPKPLSLNRLKALPPGATITDARDQVWTRLPPDDRGRPGWWRLPNFSIASSDTIHAHYRPVTLGGEP